MRYVRRTHILVLGILVVALAAAALVFAILRDDASGGGGGAVREVQASFGPEVLDDRKLVGFAQQVFVGRVLREAGTDRLDTAQDIPMTQFEVEVLANIKGNLSGTVVVNQNAGYEDDQLIVVEGDALLEPGRTYVFLTRRSAEKGWYQIVAEGFGDIRIRDAGHRAELVARFERAHRNEIPSG